MGRWALNAGRSWAGAGAARVAGSYSISIMLGWQQSACQKAETTARGPQALSTITITVSANVTFQPGRRLIVQFSGHDDDDK